MKARMIGALLALVAAAMAAPAARADDKADITALYARITTAMRTRTLRGSWQPAHRTSLEGGGKVYGAKECEQMLAGEFAMTKSMEQVSMRPTGSW